MGMLAAHKPIAVTSRVYWVGKQLENDPFQCHPYLIVNEDNSVLIDPGSVLEREHILANIETLIPLNHIRYIILHHQDPDLAACVPDLETRIGRNDLRIVTHSRMTPLLKHYGIRSAFYEIDKHDLRLHTPNGVRLRFLTTPYCHSPGAFVTYFEDEKLLFSGDIFGGLEESWQFYADETYFEHVKAFHKAYMPSREILHYALSKIEALDLEIIAPQHGSVIKKPYIRPLIEQMKQLECGLYIDKEYRQDLIETIENLQKEKLKNELILEASPNAVIAIDQHKNVILFNKRAERFFGYSKEEMIGTYSLPRIIPDHYLQQHEKALEAFLHSNIQKELTGITYELEGKRKSGEIFPIRINFGVHRSEKEIIIVATIQDISEEKKQKEIVQRHMHLAQMGEMLGMIAHQWRQPLTAIATSNRILSHKARHQQIDTQTVLQHTQKVGRYTAFLTETIEDFRKFFKPDNAPTSTTNRRIVETIVPIVSAQLQSRGIHLETVFTEPEEPYVTYGGELKQVLLTLLKNAIDAIEERRINAPCIKITTGKEGDIYIISVQDNAGGIDESVKGKIFDLFFSTKDAKTGTGLGLYMSKIIVEEHCKGKFYVENKEGGACFTIAVPSLA